jgi:methionyl-tRNA formyltransferase
MTVLFFGSSSFSLPAMKSIRSDLTGVVTRRTKPKGRGYLLEDNEVKREARSLDLQVTEIDSFDDEAARAMGETKPDLLVVVSFGLIIPKWFLALTSIGAVNVHPSLLPRYRGPSPLQWAIWNGEKETGISIIKMSERMDAGDILFQESTPIERREDASTLSNRLSLRVSEILPPVVKDVLARGVVAGEPQADDLATYTPMITKEMGRIDWSASAFEIVSQVRALVLWPTAYTFLEERMVKVFTVEEGSHGTAASVTPGSVLAASRDGIEVAAGQGSVIMKEIQIENRKRMNASDFSRGYRQITEKQFT